MMFQKYDSYKDSGLEWLGEIPSEWGVNKLKNTVKKIGDINHYMPISVPFGKPYIMTKDMSEKASLINFSNCKQISEEDYLILSKKIKPCIGDLIFARYATIGTICYVDIEKDFLVSYSCVTIKPNHQKMIGKYLFYFLKSIFFLQDINNYINFNTQGNIGIDSLYRTNLILPPLKTQTKIATYLDTQTQKIDKEIQLLEKKSLKYKELKQTLINETVLRGLDKGVKLKDSGIEWIGDIPTHWEVKRLKDSYISNMGNTILKEDLIYNGNIPVYSATAEDKYFGYINSAKLLLKKDDLVIPARGNSIGYIKLVKEKSTTTQTTISCKRRNKNIFSKYNYYYLIGLKLNVFQFDNTAIPQFTVENANTIIIMYPPLKEQIKIANYLDEKTQKIDAITKAIQTKITLLKEFRKTLINDTVTGKMKVV